MKLRINTTAMRNDHSELKGMASVTFDDQIKVTGIRIIEGKEGQLFVAMPSYKSRDGEYKDICNPINAEFREKLYNYILTAYKEEPGSTIIFNSDTKERANMTAHVSPIDGENGVKAMASIYLNDVFVFNNITIREAKEGEKAGENYVAYPSYRSNERKEDLTPVYKNHFYPVTAKVQKQLQDEILQSYQAKLKEQRKEPEQGKEQEKDPEKPEKSSKKSL